MLDRSFGSNLNIMFSTYLILFFLNLAISEFIMRKKGGYGLMRGHYKFTDFPINLFPNFLLFILEKEMPSMGIISMFLYGGLGILLCPIIPILLINTFELSITNQDFALFTNCIIWLLLIMLGLIQSVKFQYIVYLKSRKIKSVIKKSSKGEKVKANGG